MSVVLPPWSEHDSNDFSYTESVTPTPAKSSATFIIYKEDSVSATEEDTVKLKRAIPCSKNIGNHGPLNITNNVTTKQNKTVRKSFQVVSKVTAENKKKVQQRRSTDVRKVTTKSTSVAGLPQRRLTLKKQTSVQQRGVGKCYSAYLNVLFAYSTTAICL